MFWIFNLIFYILATVLATFPIIGRFFQSSGHSGGCSGGKLASHGALGRHRAIWGYTWGAPGLHGVLHPSRGAPCVTGYSASRSILGRHGVLGALRGARGVTGCLGASWGALRRHGGY
jgi:hypothetical protein